MTANRLTIYLVSTLILLASTTACKQRSPECKVMQACCDVLRGQPGVGNACSKKLLDGVEKPETCIAVLQSVDAMFEDREESLPKECTLP